MVVFIICVSLSSLLLLLVTPPSLSSYTLLSQLAPPYSVFLPLMIFHPHGPLLISGFCGYVK